MRRKLAATTFAVLLAAATAGGIAGAKPSSGKAGPNEANKQGLCTAYFNGQKKGHNKGGKASPPPFAGLEMVADDGNDDNGTGIEDVYRYCSGSIKGNPDENGRFTECFDGDGPDDDSFVCND